METLLSLSLRPLLPLAISSYLLLLSWCQYSFLYHYHNLLIFSYFHYLTMSILHWSIRGFLSHGNYLHCLLSIYVRSLIHQIVSYNTFILNTFLLIPNALLFLLIALVLPFFDKVTSSIQCTHFTITNPSILPYTLPGHYLFALLFAF